ncbi:hypothetical protein [Streptomyces sp. AC1-42T]|uniref:hypothetical protein n=1 Tax=Streptomyces sp. AC1-42T TaxID=2218665 RepID=UPI000DAB82CD|nr:hypothetical protein [Streptomyces sp. AC1-42T]PZT71440.1 hypothetical protein DNK55_32520 [Streptomyces sp. AC1-42T]
MGGRPEREHGYARYKMDGCRCYTCGFANATYCEARQRSIMYGTWQPFVDAGPVREHLLRLRNADMGLRRVAAVAGVDRQRLLAILNGRPERGTPPQEKVRPALAAAVLAVEPTWENLGGTTVISAIGTHRRLQALGARGWPQAQLARQLGWTDQNFSALLRQDHVIVRTALAVRALYGQLWYQDPRQHGVDNQAYSRALNAARSKGWSPPAAWDDEALDLPGATPYGADVQSPFDAPAQSARSSAKALS